MTLKSKLKKISKYVLLAAAINQLAFPVTEIVTSNFFPQNNISLNQVKKGKYSFHKDMSQLDFLCMARSLVTKAKVEPENNSKQSLCGDYARATVGIYRHLVNEAGREDLIDKLTLAVGEIKSPDKGLEGHAWLELELESSKIKIFDPIESFFNFSEKKKNITLNNLRKFCRLEQSSFNTEWKINYTLFRENSSGFDYPTLEAFYYPGGTARLFYLVFSDQRKR